MNEKVGLVETWLNDRRQQLCSPSPVINPSLAIIAQSQGQIFMQAVTEAVHMSARQLERLYKTQVGLSPQTVCPYDAHPPDANSPQAD